MLQGQWANDTYEPTIGFVTDPSRPYVRSIQVDSLAGADRYAVDCFLPLGIDFEHPDGFTYSKPEVGTVSYQHSSEPNTLGVITLSGVRQLPHLQQVRLVKQLPENAEGDPYYKPGTIVEYKNRLWICVNYHDRGEKAKFVSFTSPADLTIGTFNWSGVGKDSVYTDEMADASTLVDWVQNILLNDNYYLGNQNVQPVVPSILTVLQQAGETDRIRHVVPQSQAVRADLANELFDPSKIIADVHGHTPKKSRIISGKTMWMR